MALRALIFDLDDTLYDAQGAYRVALAAVGLTKDDPEFQAARNEVKARLPAGHTSARNRLLYFKVLLERRGQPGAAPLLALMARYETALADDIARQWQALGRAKLLAGLSGKLALAIVTNENLRTQLVKLAAIDPTGQLFPHVLVSEERGAEKPDHGIFKAALRALGVRPDEAMVVGDDLRHDVQPALALGIKAVWSTEFVPRKLAHQEQGAPPPGAHTVRTLDDIVSHIA